MDMEEPAVVERFLSHAREYAEERLKLIVLNLQHKMSLVLSRTMSLVVIMIVSIFTLAFLSIGLAWWIGIQLQQTFLGFMIVGGAYLVIAIVIYVNREKWIEGPVIHAFLKNVSDEEED